MNLQNTIEHLEPRIAPAAVVAIDAKTFIATITTDAGGDDLEIIQGTDGKIDVLDNNAALSLLPNGPTKILGIRIIGGAGDDVTVTKLERGLLTAGVLSAPALPEGFIITDAGGVNEHTIQSKADFTTIGKDFKFNGGAGDDKFKIQGVQREKDFTFAGGAGQDTLELSDSSIYGKLLASDVEALSANNAFQLGSVTIDNSKNTNNADIIIDALLVTGAVKYTGSAVNDTVQLFGTYNGAITMLGNNGTNGLSVGAIALKGVTFKGGTGDDGFGFSGASLGAILADMGTAGANIVSIDASMGGKGITLKGGSGIDTFEVINAVNAGALSVTLGAGLDVISTSGIFKTVKIDAGLDKATYTGGELTIGKITTKNFI